MGRVYEVVDGQLTEVSVVQREYSPFDPVLEEFRGWREYSRLAKETGEAVYAAAAFDEFKHMLLRLSKAINEVNNMATTDAERRELTTFVKAFNS